jgi:hypothetical protein
MNKLSTHLLVVLGLALLAGCTASPSTSGSAQFAVSVPQSLSTSVSRVSVTASADDFSSISLELVSSNSSWGGLLGNIPAGANRSFLAQAFDSSNTLLFQGSASGVSIAAEQTSLVAITLQQASAPPPFTNEAPVIDTFVASATSVAPGDSISLVTTAHDPNPGDSLTYAWTSTGGNFSSLSTASTSWTEPFSTGVHTLTLTVTDSRGLASSISLAVNVAPSTAQGDAQFSISFNRSPQVSTLSASPTQLAVGQSASVSASVSDLDGDSLAYSWSASCPGSWANASSPSAQFSPSAVPAGSCNNCRLTVSVSDGRGGQTTGTVALCVGSSPAPQHFNPVITSSSGSSGTASPGQLLTFQVAASDPEESALSFSWSANTGALSPPAHSASGSSISWTAPSCATAGTPPRITATVTNAFNLTDTQSFTVTGLPVCPSGWASAGSMLRPRYNHTATLLNNGKVLLSGGGQGSTTVFLAAAELYDPASGTWSTTGTMASARYQHTATLLPNGKVLVAGGDNSASGSLAAAEVYDPASGAWSPATPMGSARLYHTATLLPDGKVLVAGGQGDSGYLAAAELYNPATDTWSATAPMASARYQHTATLLPNGKVLVAGGLNNSGHLTAAELYDPASGTWSAAPPMATPRRVHAATLLPNGKVLVAGGFNSNGYLAAAELYDPATGTWSTAAPMASPRREYTAVVLPTGKVLVSGGRTTGNNYLAASELYNPASGTWSTATPMDWPRDSHTATLLPSGKVLVSGGYNGGVSAPELYTP